MRLIPRSISGRLLAISTLTTLAALLFAAFGIGHVLERFVIRGMDQQLDAEIAMLSRALRADGTLDRARVVDLPAFDGGGEGWGWRIDGPRGHWAGGDAIATQTDPSPFHGMRDRRGRDGGDILPGEGISGSGEPVHERSLVMPASGGSTVILVAGPRRLAVAPLREAMVPLLGSLAILGVVLSLAIVVQLRLGLRPLRRLQAALADVRAGRARHVPDRQPDELAPLATELNALVDHSEAQLEHARRHVANLAHGLKTPLAALAVRLAEDGHDPDGSLRAMVADIDGRVRHHLARARAVAPGAQQRGGTALAAAADDIIGVMQGIHRDRAITATYRIPPDLVVAADRQDVDEMLGNLLDNAWRHARSRVIVTAERTGRDIAVAIEDDGPGLSDDAIAEALVPGRRLDERGDGHGFGLPIAAELAELSGGALQLGRAALGGLRASLVLRAA